MTLRWGPLALVIAGASLSLAHRMQFGVLQTESSQRRHAVVSIIECGGVGMALAVDGVAGDVADRDNGGQGQVRDHACHRRSVHADHYSDGRKPTQFTGARDCLHHGARINFPSRGCLAPLAE